jgi:hypothetical protein
LPTWFDGSSDIPEDSWNGRSKAVALGAQGSVGEDAVERRNRVSSIGYGQNESLETIYYYSSSGFVVGKELAINQFGSMPRDPKGVELVLAHISTIPPSY